MIQVSLLPRSGDTIIAAIFARAAILLSGLCGMLLIVAFVGGRILLPPSEEMAYVSDRTGGLEIYRMDINHGINFQLTYSREDNLQPAWSPDGTHIAFVSQRDGNAEIYVMNTDGSGTRRLTINPASDLYPSWSPDSQSITYTSQSNGLTRIMTVSADGSLSKRLTENNNLQVSPSWSPDGKHIAFVSAAVLGDTDIFVMDADGKNLHMTISTPGNDVMPSWLPDGRLMFVSDWPHFSVQVASLDASTPITILLQNNQRLYGFPVWSPDNRWVAFSLFSSGNQSDIFMMDAACVQTPDSCAAAVRRLTTQPGSDTWPTWKP